ncbi:MAG: hypothetical protein NZ959_04210 [Armatimonadetes bacterium]|nr:hypothetical protein [Armatimonadota bacterium]MDW8121436.1 hypothetical protein [Armatimonadota bacterium]
MRRGVLQAIVWIFFWILTDLFALTPLIAQEGPQEIGLESELSIKYFPQERQWRTLDGEGTAKVTYQGLTLFARRVRYSETEKVLEAEEGLRGIFDRGAEFQGGRLLYFVDKRLWTLNSAQLTVEPGYFEEGVAEPIYFRLAAAEGRENRMTGQRGSVSSCDRPHPHYSLQSREMIMIPDDRLILRGVGLFIGRTRILSLGRYTISLKPRRQRSRLPFSPEVGQDNINGWFVRTSFGLLDTQSQSANLLLDLTQRRGTGYGLEHNYKFSRFEGGFNFTTQQTAFGGREQNLSWRHSQMLAAGLLLALNWDRRSNTPFYGLSFSNFSRLISLRKTWRRGSSQLDFRSLGYGSGRTQSSDDNWTLLHTLSSARQSVNVQVNLRQTRRFGQPTDAELTQRVEFRQRFSDAWDAALRFEQRVDPDKDRFTGDNFFYALDRTPEVSFAFRPRRASFLLPTASIGLSRWQEPQFGPTRAVTTTERVDIRLETPTRSLSLTRSLRWTHSATFHQYLYGNDTAQYLYSYRGSLNWQWGGQSSLDLSYWVQKHRGFSPFRSDALTAYENADLRMQISPSQRFVFSASTGLDIERNFFRDALLNLRWNPSRGFAFDLSSGYSLERGQWQDILGRLVISQPGGLGLPTGGTFVNYYGFRPSPFGEERPPPPPGGFRSELTFRYSPTRGEWSRVRLFLDWSPFRNWRLEGLAGYSGVLKKLDIAQFRLTRDFHCYQMWLTFNRETREFRFFFVVKAFPILQQFFGTSNEGAFLDTSVGQFY